MKPSFNFPPPGLRTTVNDKPEYFPANLAEVTDDDEVRTPDLMPESAAWMTLYVGTKRNIERKELIFVVCSEMGVGTVDCPECAAGYPTARPGFYQLPDDSWCRCVMCKGTAEIFVSI